MYKHLQIIVLFIATVPHVQLQATYKVINFTINNYFSFLPVLEKESIYIEFPNPNRCFLYSLHGTLMLSQTVAARGIMGTCYMPNGVAVDKGLKFCTCEMLSLCKKPQSQANHRQKRHILKF